MRHGPTRSVLGLVSRLGLAARDCELLAARTASHERLRVRLRREDVALEVSNHADSEPNAARVYSVLVSTGKNNVQLRLRGVAPARSCLQTLAKKLYLTPGAC